MTKSIPEMLPEGSAVRVDGWGLNDVRLTVAGRQKDHYVLRFAATGNDVPGFYHPALVRAA